jgi:hypothetical protein
MITTPEMAERHGRVLGELAELGLAAARSLAAKVEAAASREEAEGLALALHRVSRSVRLCLALESRLAQARHEIGRQDRAQAARAVETRKAQVRAAVGRDLYAESESDTADRLLDELDERLEDEALFDGFADGPLEACIARIRKDLGLPPAGPADDTGPAAAAPERAFVSSASP